MTLTETPCSEGAASSFTPCHQPEGRSVWVKCMRKWWQMEAKTNVRLIQPGISPWDCWQNMGARIRMRKGRRTLQAPKGQTVKETGRGYRDGERYKEGQGLQITPLPMVSQQASFLVIGECCAEGSVQGQEDLAGTEYLVFKENWDVSTTHDILNESQCCRVPREEMRWRWEVEGRD